MSAVVSRAPIVRQRCGPGRDSGILSKIVGSVRSFPCCFSSAQIVGNPGRLLMGFRIAKRVERVRHNIGATGVGVHGFVCIGWVCVGRVCVGRVCIGWVCNRRVYNRRVVRVQFFLGLMHTVMARNGFHNNQLDAACRREGALGLMRFDTHRS